MRLTDAATKKPRRTATFLALLTIVTVASVIVGDRAFRNGWASAPWIAWPGGASVFFIAGLIVWLVLLIPFAQIEERWSRRLAAMCLIGTGAGVLVQLLDDHVFNHAGTDNPFGIDIPFPFQDLLTGVALIILGVALLGALVTLTLRIVSARRDDSHDPRERPR